MWVEVTDFLGGANQGLVDMENNARAHIYIRFYQSWEWNSPSTSLKVQMRHSHFFILVVSDFRPSWCCLAGNSTSVSLGLALRAIHMSLGPATVGFWSLPGLRPLEARFLPWAWKLCRGWIPRLGSCVPQWCPPPPSSLGNPLPCQPFRGWMKKPEKEGSAGIFLSYPSLSLLGTGEGKCSRIKCHISINYLLAQSPFG